MKGTPQFAFRGPKSNYLKTLGAENSRVKNDIQYNYFHSSKKYKLNTIYETVLTYNSLKHLSLVSTTGTLSLSLSLFLIFLCVFHFLYADDLDWPLSLGP